MTIEIPYGLAVTGRVESWLNSPSKRLPVSCTVFVAEDSMEGEGGIEESWLFASKALRNAAGVAIHLSKLRPRGVANADGLVASGPVSFGKIYSKLNEILRRGGVFKNGAITLHLDYDHPDAVEFITAPRNELPWVKRALNIDDNFIKWEYLDVAMKGLRSGDLWLVKKSYDKDGNRLYHNVCLEILLRHTATCLLSHVNLGGLTIAEIPDAFKTGMEFLCKLHGVTGVGESGIYLSPEKDRQVGLGVIGLANLLAIEGITYEQFVRALENREGIGLFEPTPAERLVLALQDGYAQAAQVAREYNMERAFTVAPTATCSYRYTDREGYTTTPEIAPPIDRQIDRDSDTFGVKSYDYNPKVEIAAEVGWNTFFRLNVEWQKLMDSTGLAHAMSTNWWSDMVEMNESFLDQFLRSPLKSLYYSLQVMPATQDKSTVFFDNDFSILGLGNVAQEEETEQEYSFCSSCSE